MFFFFVCFFFVFLYSTFITFYTFLKLETKLIPILKKCHEKVLFHPQSPEEFYSIVVVQDSSNYNFFIILSDLVNKIRLFALYKKGPKGRF